MGTCTGDKAETQEEEEDNDGQENFDLKSASIARLRRMTHTPIERLVPWTNLGGEDNKQDHKRIKPVRRLCEHANFEE